MEKRKEGIGASEAAASMGMSKWKGRRTLYFEKKGVIDGFEGTYKTRFGNHAESLLKEFFEETQGTEINRRHFIFAHSDHDFMRCNLDYWATKEKVPVEMKTSSSITTDEWQDNNVPDDYFWQCQHQMSIMDVDHMYIAVYFFVSGEFIVNRIERCKESEQAMIKLESEFWDHIQNDTEPALSLADDNLLNTPASDNVMTVAIDMNSSELIARRFNLVSIIKNCEREKKELDNRIKESMGDASVATNDHYRVTWKKDKREREMFRIRRVNNG